MHVSEDCWGTHVLEAQTLPQQNIATFHKTLKASKGKIRNKTIIIYSWIESPCPLSFCPPAPHTSTQQPRSKGRSLDPSAPQHQASAGHGALSKHPGGLKSFTEPLHILQPLKHLA